MSRFRTGLHAGTVLLVMTALVLVGALSIPAGAAVFSPRTKTLANGLEVVVVENHRAPVVTHMLWYKVGAMDEPQGKSGLAHFLEHLMFKATDKLKAGEFSAIVARNGGNENAFTTQDYTAYFQSVSKDRLGLMMKLEADRMVNLKLTPEVIEPERKVILEERRMRTDNDAGSQLQEESGAALFRNHPYGTPVIGWEREIEHLSIDDITSFYKRYYAPNNAIVVVAGDVKADEVFKLAEKYYGRLKPSDLPTRPDWREPPHRADIMVTMKDARVKEPSWSRRMTAPSFATGPDKDIYPLEVLINGIGGGGSSVLYQSLVVDKKVANSAGAWFDPAARGPGQIVFYAEPAKGVTVEELQDAFQKELAGLAKNPLSDADIEKIKRRLVDSAELALDSLSTPARVLGQALAIGRSVDDVENYPDRIEAVTPEQVRDVAARYLSRHGYVTSILLPKATESVSTGEAENKS